MRRLTSILAICMLLGACEKYTIEPETAVAYTPLEFASRLRAWAMAQPNPYVVVYRGWPDSGSMYGEFPFVTNLSMDTLAFLEIWHDSLLIDTSNVSYHLNSLSESRIRELVDSAALPLTEQAMMGLLGRLSLKLRRMRYDSANYLLAYRLCQWSNSQGPPRVIRCGWYMLTYEAPNSGGYSGSRLSFSSFQNAQFLTRFLQPSQVQAMADSITPSRSESYLTELLAPIGPVKFYTTTFGRE